MNDELFNYLVATDELDDFLGYELKCPNCGSKLLEIVYGMPSSDIMDQVEKGEVFIGGCCVDEENPESTENLSKSDRDFLDLAISDYNKMFGTSYDTSSEKFQNYYILILALCSFLQSRLGFLFHLFYFFLDVHHFVFV